MASPAAPGASSGAAGSSTAPSPPTRGRPPSPTHARALWVRLAMAMAIIALVPLGIAGTQAARIAADIERVRTEAALSRSTVQVATLMYAWLNGRAQSLSGWAEPWDADAASPDERTSLTRSIYLAMPDLVTVVLVDPLGQPVSEPLWLAKDDMPGTRFAGRIPGGPNHVQGLLSHLPERSAALPSTPGALARVAVGAPYRIGRGVAVALVAWREGGEVAVAAELALDGLEEAFSGANRQGLALLTADGRAVIGDVEGAGALATRLKPLLGTTASFTDDDLGVQGAIAPVADTDWSVLGVAGIGGADTTHAIRTIVLQMSGLAVLLVVALAFLLQRQVSAPVGRLREAALSVADGDLGRRIDEDRTDELGDLQRAFNHMAMRLERNRKELDHQRREIEAFNQVLQQRVEERTRELREAQAGLVQSGQLAAVAELGAGLAHELNNPLAGILGLTQIMRAQEPQSRLLSRVEEMALRCRDVVAQLLRLTGEGPEIAAVSCDLREVLVEVAALVQRPFAQRSVRLDVSVNAPVPCRADSVTVSRIVAQILGSLRAGLPMGAALEVTAIVEADRVGLTFASATALGEGAAGDDWRASGAGLWLARHLLDRAGGALTVDSTPPAGRVTCWRLLLPRAS
jgi:two-component system NtrC family sensor kinase